MQTFVDLPIRELRLTANKIATIEEQAFVKLTRIERISLARNQLTELDPRSFVDLPRFRDFTICRNKSSQLQKNVFQFLETKNLSIDLALNRIETVNRVFGGIREIFCWNFATYFTTFLWKLLQKRTFSHIVCTNYQSISDCIYF
jgi:Leucine-rich repeat (LRR) protein